MYMQQKTDKILHILHCHTAHCCSLLEMNVNKCSWQQTVYDIKNSKITVIKYKAEVVCQFWF